MNFVTLLLILLGVPSANAAPESWRTIAAGVEYATVSIAPKPAIGDGLLHVLRIDDSKAHLKPLCISKIGGNLRTARQWRSDFNLIAVINAGMYERDFSTHTGYFRIGEHINSSKWVKNYQSIFLLGPRQPELQKATIADAETKDSPSKYAAYETVSQNLRLIRTPGVNVWKQSERRWSEAAIGLDDKGRMLFFFSRSPLSMHDFANLLIKSSIGIVRAMHVEGGPEASLSIKGGGIAIDLAGSYETGFNENDDNRRQWPLPNVIGVEARPFVP